MSLLPRSPSTPEKIYSSSLEPLGLGHAVWHPEPHRSGEVQIGDVGFLKDGAFIRLFNLDTSAPEKKVTCWSPPFEIADPPPPGVWGTNQRAQVLAPGHYRSHGVQSQDSHLSVSLSLGSRESAGIATEHTCTASQGAVLVLKSEARIQEIVMSSELQDYVRRHHARWCAYAKDVLHIAVQPAAIVVVRGWVKTRPDWAITVFSGASSRRSVSLPGGAAKSISESMDGPATQRHGQDYLSTPSDTASTRAQDQTIFVQQYRVERRFRFPGL